MASSAVSTGNSRASRSSGFISLQSQRQHVSDEEDGQLDSNKMALGIAFGPLLGVALGLALGDIAIGISIGMSLGICLGLAWGLT